MKSKKNNNFDHVIEKHNIFFDYDLISKNVFDFLLNEFQFFDNSISKIFIFVLS